MTLALKISIVAVVTGLSDLVPLAVYSWQRKYDPRTYGYNMGDASARKDEGGHSGMAVTASPTKHHMTQQERLAAYVYLFSDNGRF